LVRTVPDTITSWQITGFSINKQNGLGITEKSSKVTVFKPFFVTTQLPYSVKRGEVLTISVQVMNYMTEEKKVQVIMYNNEAKFDFEDAKDDENIGGLTLFVINENS
jgi:CD109 antigen